MLTVAKTVYLNSCHYHPIEVNRPVFVEQHGFKMATLAAVAHIHQLAKC